MPYWFDYTMDGKVIAALVAVSFLTVLVFGLVPALQASKADVNRILKDGGRSGIRVGGTRRWTTAFLAGEIALTVVLLAQAVVTARNDGNDLASDSRIDSSELLSASIALPPAQYSSPEQRRDFYTRVVARLATIPDVTAASVTSALPLHGSIARSLEIDGQTQGQGEKPPTVSTISIDRGYLETLGVPIHRGRAFAEDDGLPGREHVIVSQRFAETYFPGVDPLGRRIRLSGASASPASHAWHTIVGVSSDLRQHSRPGAETVVYLPIGGDAPSAATIVVRSASDPASLAASLRQAVMSVDRNLPLYRIITLKAAIRDAQWAARISYGLITTLTCIALALSIAGLYAVTMYAVGQRTPEIGLRMALGARPGAIRRLILRDACLQAGLGLALGLAGSVLWDAAFSSGRVNVRLFDPHVLIPVGVLLAAATVLACLVPVRRATRLDPVAALRSE
jgi:putative ABC transport system permease protein